MSTPISHDPAKIRTADGGIWLRAAVTTAGRGLYALEGVEGCPRYVLATLPELAVYGVQVVVDELVDAVALLGALPMPVGDPAPGALAEQRHLADERPVWARECPSCGADADVTGYRIPTHRKGCPQADDRPADDRRAESVAKLRGLLARQSGGTQ